MVPGSTHAIWVMTQHAVLDLCGVVALADLIIHELHPPQRAVYHHR
jgi:hypothetical protein